MKMNPRDGASIKEMQSEMGVTGPASEANYRLMEGILNSLKDNFVHKHDGHVTEKDACLMISTCHMGYRLNESVGAGMIIGFEIGCETTIIEMITEYLIERPYAIDVFTQAINRASIHLLTQNNEDDDEE